jgi:hypothetical protein
MSVGDRSFPLDYQLGMSARMPSARLSRPWQGVEAMTPWAVQVITLLGVALGALASFVSTRAIDRSRWQREEALRWDSKRLECYSDFSAAITRFINIGDRIASGLGLPAVVEPLDSDTGLPALTTAEAELTRYWAQLLILGSPEVVTAAQNWRNQAWLAESFARGHGNADQFEVASQNRRKARGRFYEAVRTDLGITSGDISADIGRRLQWSELRQQLIPNDGSE